MQKSLERMSKMLIKVNDRSRSSMERLTQSIEKQAAAYGKTEVERLIADRDRYIKKLGDEQGMVDRVTAAYNKMIEAAGKSGGSEIKQLGAEARESKASLALMGEEIGVHIPRHIRGFISSMPGVGAALSAAFSGIAVVALIGVIVEAIKKVAEFRETSKSCARRRNESRRNSRASLAQPRPPTTRCASRTTGWRTPSRNWSVGPRTT